MIRSFLTSMFRRSPRPIRRPARTRLGLESLDARLNPAHVDVLNGTLTVQGCQYVKVEVVGSNYRVTTNFGIETKPATGVYAIDVTGTPANDNLTVDLPNNYSGFDVTIDGGDGNDELYGWCTGVTLFGGTGNDTLMSSGGNDLLVGGRGTDSINGSYGHDTICGDDMFSFDPSLGEADSIFAGPGNDTVYAGAGKDTVRGAEGDDWIYGGYGDDTVFGEADSDHLYGGQGNDVLDGGLATDWLFGEDGRDTLTGGADSDFLNGGSGADTFTGNEGADTFTGTHDVEYLMVWNGRTGQWMGTQVSDAITDFASNDWRD